MTTTRKSSISGLRTSANMTPAPSTRGDAKLTLERVLGITSSHNSSIAINPHTGEVAYPAGCVVVIYCPRRNRQVRFFRSSKSVSCLSFSRDGKYLAVGERGHQPSVLVWDMDNGDLKADLKAHKFGVSCLAFSDDARHLVSVGFRHDRYLYLWDWQSTNQKVLASSKISQKVYSIDFSEDGSFFVTCGEKHVKFWHVASKEELLASAKGDGVAQLDGRAAVMAAHKDATFIDVACSRGVDSAQGNTVFCITSHGVLCSFGPSRLMERWVSLETTAGYSLSVTSQYVMCGCANGVVRLFDPWTLQYITTLPRPPHFGGLNEPPNNRLGESDAPLSPDGSRSGVQYGASICLRATGAKVVVLYSDRSLFFWDVKDITNIGRHRSFAFHSACIWDIQVSSQGTASLTTSVHTGTAKAGGVDVDRELPPGSFVTCSTDNTIRFWNLDVNKRRTEAGDRDNSEDTKKWQIPYSKELLHVIYIDDPKDFRAAAMNPAFKDPQENRVLGGSCTSHGMLDTEIPEKPDTGAGLRSLALHPESRHIASGDKQGNLRVHDLSTMKLISLQAAHDTEILSLDYSPIIEVEHNKDSVRERRDILLATGSRDRLVHIFDVNRKYALRQTLENHSASVTAIKFSKDGRHIFSCGGDKTIVLSSLDDKTVRRTKSIAVPYGTVFDLDVDATSKYLVTSGQDKRLNIWSIKTGKHVRSYKPQGEGGELFKVQLDPAGVYAAACSFDKWIRLFDFYSGACVAKVSGHSELITGVKFTPDCRRLISVGGDGCIFVWRLAPELTAAIKGRHAELFGHQPLQSSEDEIMADNKDPGVEAEDQAKPQHQIGGRLIGLTDHVEDSIHLLSESPPEPPSTRKAREGKVAGRGTPELKDNKKRRDHLHQLLEKSAPSLSQKRPISTAVEETERAQAVRPLTALDKDKLPAWARTTKLPSEGPGETTNKNAQAEEKDRKSTKVESRWAQRSQEDYELFSEQTAGTDKLGDAVTSPDKLSAILGATSKEYSVLDRDKAKETWNETMMSKNLEQDDVLMDEPQALQERSGLSPPPLTSRTEAGKDEEEEETSSVVYYMKSDMEDRGLTFNVALKTEVKEPQPLMDTTSEAEEPQSSVLEEQFKQREEQSGKQLQREVLLLEASDKMEVEKGENDFDRLNLRNSLSRNYFKGATEGRADKDDGDKGQEGDEEHSSAPKVLASPSSPIAAKEQGEGIKSLAEERKSLRLRQKHQATADAVSNMTERLRDLGILPSEPSSLDQEESGAGSLKQEGERQDDLSRGGDGASSPHIFEREVEKVADREHGGDEEAPPVFQSESPTSISARSIRLKNSAPEVKTEKDKHALSGQGLSRSVESLRRSSTEGQGVSRSLSAFISGHSSLQPARELNVSYSTIPKGYRRSSQTVHPSTSPASSLDGEVNVSYSAFISGYGTGTTSAEEETVEKKSSAGGAEQLTAVDVSYSTFIPGYTSIARTSTGLMEGDVKLKNESKGEDNDLEVMDISSPEGTLIASKASSELLSKVERGLRRRSSTGSLRDGDQSRDAGFDTLALSRSMDIAAIQGTDVNASFSNFITGYKIRNLSQVEAGFSDSFVKAHKANEGVTNEAKREEAELEKGSEGVAPLAPGLLEILRKGSTPRPDTEKQEKDKPGSVGAGDVAVVTSPGTDLAQIEKALETVEIAGKTAVSQLQAFSALRGTNETEEQRATLTTMAMRLRSVYEDIGRTLEELETQVGKVEATDREPIIGEDSNIPAERMEALVDKYSDRLVEAVIAKLKHIQE